MSLILNTNTNLDPFLAVPPQTYPSESFDTLYAERFQFGTIEGKIIHAEI